MKIGRCCHYRCRGIVYAHSFLLLILNPLLIHSLFQVFENIYFNIQVPPKSRYFQLFENDSNIKNIRYKLIDVNNLCVL